MNHEPRVVELDSNNFQFESTLVGSDPHQPLGKSVGCGDEHGVCSRNDIQRASTADSVLSG